MSCFFPSLDSGFTKLNVPLWPIIILLFTCGKKMQNSVDLHDQDKDTVEACAEFNLMFYNKQGGKI